MPIYGTYFLGVPFVTMLDASSINTDQVEGFLLILLLVLLHRLWAILINRFSLNHPKWRTMCMAGSLITITSFIDCPEFKGHLSNMSLKCLVLFLCDRKLMYFIIIGSYGHSFCFIINQETHEVIFENVLAYMLILMSSKITILSFLKVLFCL